MSWLIHATLAQLIRRIYRVPDRMPLPPSCCQDEVCKISSLGGKANRHKDPSWSPRKTKEHRVAHLGLIASSFLCHLWELGGELCSVHSYTLILSGVSIRLRPKHKDLQTRKVTSSTTCSVVICGSQTYNVFHTSLRVKPGWFGYCMCGTGCAFDLCTKGLVLL